jgi:hypothetical protein
MAFNLAGFGAGFAGKLSERLDEDRVRAEKLIDENRQIATRQRLAKQAQRDQEKKIAEEMLGTLKALGLSDDQAANVVGQGKGSFKVHETLGLKALEKGVPFSSLLSDNNGEIEEAATTLDITDAAPIKAAGLGSSYWNNENVAALYGEVPDNAVSLDLQISRNANEQLKLIQGPVSARNTAKLNTLREAEKFLLEKHAALAANSREDSDTGTPVTVTTRKTLEDFITKNHGLETTKYGFGWDAEAQMEIAFSGNEGGGYSALLSSVYKMEQSIGQSGDDWVNARLKQERQSVERGLNRHAANKINEAKENGEPIESFGSFEEYETAINSGRITKPGTVSYVNNTLYVYTGVPNTAFNNGPIFESQFGSS